MARRALTAVAIALCALVWGDRAEAQSLQIVAPPSGSRYPLAHPTPLTIEWTADPAAASYLLEYTGLDRIFSRANATQPDPINGMGGSGGGVVVTENRLSVVLEPAFPRGSVQVRVVARSASGEPVGSFSDAITIHLGAESVALPARPVVTAPPNGTGFPLSVATPLTIAWTPVPGAARYGLEYTGFDRAFANPGEPAPDTVNGFGGAGGLVLAEGTSLAAVLDAALPHGSVQFRILAFGGDGQPIGSSSAAVTLRFGPPAIASVTPATGLSGTMVTIRGAGFGPRSAVTFGGEPAPIVGQPTPTEITAIVPFGAGPPPGPLPPGQTAVRVDGGASSPFAVLPLPASTDPPGTGVAAALGGAATGLNESVPLLQDVLADMQAVVSDPVLLGFLVDLVAALPGMGAEIGAAAATVPGALTPEALQLLEAALQGVAPIPSAELRSVQTGEAAGLPGDAFLDDRLDFYGGTDSYARLAGVLAALCFVPALQPVCAPAALLGVYAGLRVAATAFVFGNIVGVRVVDQAGNEVHSVLPAPPASVGLHAELLVQANLRPNEFAALLVGKLLDRLPVGDLEPLIGPLIDLALGAIQMQLPSRAPEAPMQVGFERLRYGCAAAGDDLVVVEPAGERAAARATPAGLQHDGESIACLFVLDPDVLIPGEASSVLLPGDRDRTTHSFRLPVRLQVSVQGDGTVLSTPGGILCGSGGTCEAPFAYGQSVSLQAIPPENLEGWSGACGGRGGCSVVLTQRAHVTATFVPLGRVSVTVRSSVGDLPVAGASVSVGGRQAVTGPDGTAVLEVSVPGTPVPVGVEAAGFEPRTASVLPVVGQTVSVNVAMDPRFQGEFVVSGSFSTWECAPPGNTEHVTGRGVMTIVLRRGNVASVSLDAQPRRWSGCFTHVDPGPWSVFIQGTAAIGPSGSVGVTFERRFDSGVHFEIFRGSLTGTLLSGLTGSIAWEFHHVQDRGFHHGTLNGALDLSRF